MIAAVPVNVLGLGPIELASGDGSLVIAASPVIVVT